MKRFEVPIVYRGQCNFIVEADNEDAAVEVARQRFNSGERPEEMGNEWEKIERTGEVRKVEN